MTPISTAFCAYGMSGSVFHGPLVAAHPGFDLHKVWERTTLRIHKDFPQVASVKSLEEILNDDQIELIVVNTPEETHYEYARLALEANKHVIVEKAFTVTYDQAITLRDLAKQNKLKLSVFQNRRWDSDFLTVQKVIDEKLVGELVSYEAHYDRFRNYIQADTWKETDRPGTGVLYNLGAHLIDQALVLFGMPEAVWAALRIQRPNGKVTDSFDLILHYPSCAVTLKVSYLVKEPGPKYALHGTMGSFLKYGLDPQEDALKSGKIPNSEDWGYEPKTMWGTLHTTINGLTLRGKVASMPGNYLAYYQNIYEAIRENKALQVTAQQGANVIRIIEAAQQSHSQKHVVPIEDDVTSGGK